MKVRVVFAVLIILAGFLSWRIGMAQSGPGRYFYETGHWVHGEFLTAYENTPYGEELYGPPISTFFEKEPNLWVQYFNKARFELHLDAPAGQRVRITNLGEILYEAGAGIPNNENTTDCRSFPETGYEVCSSFLEYFESRGGAAQFGYPVSNSEKVNDQNMQYFQKARLEFDPNLPAGQRVVVSDLGRIYFHYIDENPVYMMPEPGDPTIEGTIRIKSRAYPQQAVTPLGGSQTVHVIVQDQRLKAVEDALVYLEVRMPHGEAAPVVAPDATDENGVALFEFPFSSIKPGMVEVWVRVEKGDSLETRTVTSFRTWW